MVFAASPDVLPSPQPLSITQVFELVQSLLGHTTWLTEAMGNSNEGTVSLVGSFYANKDKTLCHRTAHLPPRQNARQSQCGYDQVHRHTVQWHGHAQTGTLGRQTAVGAGTGGSGERPWEEPWQCLLVIIHFTQGMRPQGWAANARKSCQMV